MWMYLWGSPFKPPKVVIEFPKLLGGLLAIPSIRGSLGFRGQGLAERRLPHLSRGNPPPDDSSGNEAVSSVSVSETTFGFSSSLCFVNAKVLDLQPGNNSAEWPRGSHRI